MSFYMDFLLRMFEFPLSSFDSSAMFGTVACVKYTVILFFKNNQLLLVPETYWTLLS